MGLFNFLFRTPAGESPGSPEPVSKRCERQEERRQNALRAYSEEHLFGYVDADGNMSDRPRNPRD